MGSPVSAIKGPSFGSPLRSPYSGSPFAVYLPEPTAPAREEGSAEDLGELAEDAEFAAEEHAHRCHACGPATLITPLKFGCMHTECIPLVLMVHSIGSSVESA